MLVSWGLGAGAGTGSVFDPYAGGGSAVSPPQGNLKGLVFQVLEHSCPMCPNLGNYSIGSIFSHFPLV